MPEISQLTVERRGQGTERTLTGDACGSVRAGTVDIVVGMIHLV